VEQSLSQVYIVIKLLYFSGLFLYVKTVFLIPEILTQQNENFTYLYSAAFKTNCV